MDVETKIKVLFFKNSSPEEIYTIIKEYSLETKEKFIEIVDCIMQAELDLAKKEKVVLAFEELFLIKNFRFLCKNLFMFYDSIGNEEMAKYFLEVCNEDEPDCLKDIKDIVEKYENKLINSLRYTYYKNNFYKKYNFNGIDKRYYVYSFSNEIGNNMTLIKTPYGSLIFDCGAKCSLSETKYITCEDIKDFLYATNTNINDIKGCFITHAHFDHYGSVNSLIEAGVPKNKIFIGSLTKELILNSSQELLDISNSFTPESFFVANNVITVNPICNGHILGSQAFLISFDNVNIFITGDFCMHNQLTVPGLNINDVLSNKNVIQYGVDCLITESTYGHTIHYSDYDSSAKALLHFTDIFLNNNYKIFFPTFAIGRSQEVTCMLNKKYTILLDGLSVKISKLYEKLSNIKIFNERTRFNVEEDKMYNFDVNNIIVASSGMISEGSTSFKYVEEMLKNNNNIAIFKTGFISSESAGAELLNEWKIKENILVDIPLSAHASYDEIIELIKTLSPRNIVTIHGEGLMKQNEKDIEFLSTDCESEKEDYIDKMCVDNISNNNEVDSKHNDNIDNFCEVKEINDEEITEDDFIDARVRIKNSYINNDKKEYKIFIKAIEGNKIFENAKFEYVHKKEATVEKEKGFYADIPILNINKHSSNSSIVINEIYEAICNACEKYESYTQNISGYKSDSNETKMSDKTNKCEFSDEVLSSAKITIDNFNKKTNYSKSIKTLIEYMNGNPIFEGVKYKVVTRSQQTKEKKRGLYVTLPSLGLTFHDEIASNVVKSIIDKIELMYKESLDEKDDSYIIDDQAHNFGNGKDEKCVYKNSKNELFNDVLKEVSREKEVDTESEPKGKQNQLGIINSESEPKINKPIIKEKVQITDPYLIAKIKNVVMTGLPLKENNISLENSTPFKNSVDLLFRVLKRHPESKDLLYKLQCFNDNYSMIYDEVVLIKNNNYTYERINIT